MKTPILDGASGLHYSGQTYMNNVQMMTNNICSGQTISYSDPAFSTPYANGVAPSGNQLPIDKNTKRVAASALEGYVNTLIQQNVIPDQMPTIDSQIAADTAFYTNLQSEYCYYETRYLAALTQFITEVSNTNATATSGQAALNKTIQLNQTLNTLLEIMNYIGNKRARAVNDRNNLINVANEKINTRLADLRSQQTYLQSSDVRIKTQTEMMRFSKEKNNAMNIQIMFFVALNVVALGTVFVVYKNVRGP